MKRTKLMIGLAMLLVMSCGPSLYAQSINVEMQVPTTTSVSGTVRVTIPFQFSAAGKEFTGGEYLIARSSEKAITIRSLSSNGTVVVLTNSIVSRSTVVAPKLVFHKYGDRYFLTQAWLRVSDLGRELFVSPEEIKLARSIQQEQVTLVSKK